MNRSLVLVSLFISLGFFFRGNEAQAFSKSETEHAVKGCVRDADGNPVKQVVVTNGTDFTSTNDQGEYLLPAGTSQSRFVYISVPSEYQIPETNGISDGFYQEIGEPQSDGNYNFTLTKRVQPSTDFVYLAISDPQVINEEQLKRFCDETVPDLRQTATSHKGKEVYGVVLGDLVWDAMQLYTPYKTAISGLGITFFQTIGNHDHNLQYADRSNTADLKATYAEKEYEDTFGPVNYSFNAGNVHVITLKNQDYVGNKKYTERLGKEQLDWLKNDLSYVKPGSTVFLNMHAPAFNTTDGGRGNIRDARDLQEILSPYKAHVFAGHTHFYENHPVTASLYEHNIGAACGAWWAGEVNRCGAPNGYLVVQVNGDKVSWNYKATGRDDAYQFRIYAPGEFLSQPKAVVVNVWDWDPSFNVEWIEDGASKGVMQQFDEEDQDYITMQKGKASGYQTHHLFRAQPSDKTKELQIKVTNRFGETYTQAISLN